MSICQRIFDCMGQDKAKLRALAQNLGIAPSTVSTWKLRHTDPPARYIVAIANFLKISPLYLLTGDHQYNHTTPIPQNLSPTEGQENHTELCSLYDTLDRPGQIIMLATGYQQQLRLQGTNKAGNNEITPPKFCSKYFFINYNEVYDVPHLYRWEEAVLMTGWS